MHLYIRKLGCFERPEHWATRARQQETPGAGWEYVYVTIDNYSRVAFSSVHPDETSWSACLPHRPYSLRINGKAERFIQTAFREWAYARSYASLEERGSYLPAWLHQYNRHRPYASLDYHPPVSRLGLSVNNLVDLHRRDHSAGQRRSRANVECYALHVAAARWATGPCRTNRAGRVPMRLLNDYVGCLVTGGYESYTEVVRQNDITHSCWLLGARAAQVRRRPEVQSKGKTGNAD